MKAVAQTSEPTAVAGRAGPDSAPQCCELQTAQITTHWGRSGAVLVADGEIDAANAPDVADYLERCAEQCEWLILDLSELEFFGTAGFDTLRMLSDRCAAAALRWMLVPGMVVGRLLQVCDPNSHLPIAESVPAALARLQIKPDAARP